MTAQPADPEAQLPTTDDVLAWLKAAARTWPEPVQLPDELEGDPPLPVLADARSRLAAMSETARAVRREVDAAILTRIGPYGAIRWGDRLLQPGTGDVKIADDGAFFNMLIDAFGRVETREELLGLLKALINPKELKIGGLKKLAAVLGQDVKAVRATITAREKPSSPIVGTTRQNWPLWAEHMKDGEAHITKVQGFDQAELEEDREAPAEEER